VEVNVSAIRMGDRWTTLALVRDITDRKRAEQEIRDSEARLSLALEVGNAGVWELDLTNNRFNFDDHLHTMFGSEPGELPKEREQWRTYYHPDDLVGLQEKTDAYLEGEKRYYENEHRVRAKDGSYYWVFTRGQIAHDGRGGKSRRILGIAMNITDRKNAEVALNRAANQLRMIADNIPAFITYTDVRDLRYRFVNRPYAASFDMTPEQMIGKHVKDALGEQAYERALPYIRRAQAGERMSYENIVPIKGEARWFNVNYIPEFDEQGVPQNIIVLAFDITDLKRTEARLRESEQKFSRIFHSNPLPLAIRRVSDNRYIDINQSAAEQTGYSRTEYLGHTPLELGLYDKESFLQTTVMSVAGRLRNHEVNLRTKSGEIRTYLLSTEPIELSGEACALAALLDITERKRAEEALRESEFRIKSIGDSITDGMIYQASASLDGRRAFTYVSDSVRRLYGATPEEVMADASLIYGRICEEDLPAVMRLEAEALQKLTPFRAEVRVRGPSGETRWSSIISTPRRMPDGTVRWDGLEFVITERKKAEEALRESQARLMEAQRIAHLGNWEHDLVSDKITMSEEFLRIFEIDSKQLESRVEEVLKAIHPEDKETVSAAYEHTVTTGAPYQVAHRIQMPDGRIKHVRAQGETHIGPRGKPIRLAGTLQDITAQERLEEQVRQSQKMEAIGQLAGGVAHDFNNILLAIIMQLELLRMSSSADAEIQQGLDELDVTAQRAAALTRQLLMFSRRSVLEIKVLDLNDVVANLLKMLSRLLGEDNTLVFERKTALPAIEADAGMLEQVLMNLAVNARDAMPKGGRITLSTEAVQFDSDLGLSNPDRRAGRYVCLSVCDTGMGMDEETLKRIFEPFFTTKPQGKGTGLGLATVYGIVAQHRGWVDVESRLGKGTTFRVYLPESSKRTEEAAEEKDVGARPGKESILVAEDDPSVRQVLVMNLCRLGYQIYEASTGPEALAVWKEHQEQIELLLTDLVMPDGMTGLELAELVHADKPSLKVIISSGYSPELVEQGKPTDRSIVYLAKPYRMSLLGKVIRDCLDGKVKSD
jgi:PAS domain S-box-containing protein